LRNPVSLETAARKSIAREALQLGADAWDQGERDRAQLEVWADLAIAAYPAVSDTRFWNALERRKKGPYASILRYSPRPFVRDVEARIKWRRWRWSGL